MDNIKVAIRVRPLISREQDQGYKAKWTVKEQTVYATDYNGKPGKVFTFDRIFDEHMTTMDIFCEFCKPIIISAVEGFHGTIFAYGQSSSGKTYTMSGGPVHPGIISLSMQEIFDIIEATSDREFLLRVSYMEIYKEQVTDLLTAEEKPLKIQEDAERNIHVQGLTEVLVQSKKEVLDIIKKGDARKHMAETKQNERSSRSHSIIRMILESRKLGDDGAVIVSHLNFVDLAGSEKAGENSLDRLREGSKINTSLLALRQVISKLSDGIRESQHIGYRDSNLTRILQNALGGNSKTSIVCTITPASNCVEESYSTLRFASSAKKIENKPHVNECLSDAALLKKYESEITRLQKLVNETGIAVAQAEKEDLQKKLLEKEEAQKEQEELISKLKQFIIIAKPVRQPVARVKRRETWCPGKDLKGFVEMPGIDESKTLPMIEDISPPKEIEFKINSRLNFVESRRSCFFENNESVFSSSPDPQTRELIKLQDKYEDLLQDHKKLHKENDELKTYHESEILTLEDTVEELIQKIESLKNTIHELQQELEKVKLERNTVSDQVYQLEHKLQIQSTKLADCQNELMNVRNKTAETVPPNTDEVDNLTELNEKLSSEVSELKILNEEITHRQSASEEMYQLKIQDLQEKSDMYEITVGDFREELEKAETDKEKLKLEVADLQEEVLTLKQEIDNLVSLEYVKTEIESKTSDIRQNYEEQLSNLRTEHELDKQNLLSEISDLNKKLTETVENLNVNKSDHEAKIMELEENHKQEKEIMSKGSESFENNEINLKEELKILQTDKEELKLEVTKLQEQVIGLKEEMDGMVSLEYVKTEVECRTVDIKSKYEEELSEYENQKLSLLSEISDLQKKLSESAENSDAVRAEYEVKIKEMEDKHKQEKDMLFSQKSDACENAETDLMEETQKSQNNKLKLDIEKLQEEIIALKEEMDSMVSLEYVKTEVESKFSEMKQNYEDQIENLTSEHESQKHKFLTEISDLQKKLTDSVESTNTNEIKTEGKIKIVEEKDGSIEISQNLEIKGTTTEFVEDIQNSETEELKSEVSHYQEEIIRLKEELDSMVSLDFVKTEIESKTSDIQQRYEEKILSITSEHENQKQILQSEILDLQKKLTEVEENLLSNRKDETKIEDMDETYRKDESLQKSVLFENMGTDLAQEMKNAETEKYKLEIAQLQEELINVKEEMDSMVTLEYVRTEVETKTSENQKIHEEKISNITSQYESQLQSLLTEISDLKRKLTESEDNLMSYGRNETKVEEMDETFRRDTDMLQKSELLESSGSDLREEIKNAEMDKLKSELCNLREEMLRLKEEMDSMVTVEYVKTEIQSKTSEMQQNYEEKISSMTSEHENQKQLLVLEISDLQKKLTEAVENISSRKDETKSDNLDETYRKDEDILQKSECDEHTATDLGEELKNAETNRYKNEVAQLQEELMKVKEEMGSMVSLEYVKAEIESNTSDIRQNYEEQLSSLRTEHESKQQTLFSEIEDLQTKLTEVEEALNLNKIEYENKIAEIKEKQLLQKPESFDNATTDIGEELQKSEMEKEKVQQEVSKLQEEVISLKEEMDSMVSLEYVKTEIESETTNIRESYEEQILTLTSEHESHEQNLLTEISNLQMKLTEAEENLCLCKSEYEEKITQIEEKYRQNQKPESPELNENTLSELREEIKKSEIDNEKLKQEVAQLQEEVITLKEEIDSRVSLDYVKTEVESKMADVRQSYEEKVSELESQRLTLLSENSDLQARLSDLQTGLSEAMENVSLCKNEYEGKIREMEEKHRQETEKLQENLLGLEEEKNHLNHAIEEYKSLNTDFSDLKASYDQKSEIQRQELQKEINKQERQLSELTDTGAGQYHNKNENQEQNEIDVEKVREQYQANILTLSQEHDEQIQTYHNEISRLQEKIGDLSAELDSKQETCDQLKIQVNESKSLSSHLVDPQTLYDKFKCITDTMNLEKQKEIDKLQEDFDLQKQYLKSECEKCIEVVKEQFEKDRSELIYEYEEKLKTLTVDCDMLRCEVDRLQDQLKSSNEVVGEQLEKDRSQLIHEYEEKLKALTVDCDVLRCGVDGLQDQLKSSKEEMQQRSRQLEEEKKKTSVLEEREKKLKDVLAEKERKLIAALKRFTEAYNDNKNFKKETIKEKEELNKTIQQYEKTFDQYEQKIKTMEEENNTRMEISTSSICDTNSTIVLTDKMQKLENKNLDLMKQLSELSELTKENERLQGKVTELEEICETHKNHLTDLQQKTKDEKEDRGKHGKFDEEIARKNIDDLLCQLEEEKKKSSALADQEKELKDMLEQKEKKLIAALQKFTKACNENLLLKRETTKENEKHKKRIQQYNETIDQYEERIRRMENEFRRCRQEDVTFVEPSSSAPSDNSAGNSGAGGAFNHLAVIFLEGEKKRLIKKNTSLETEIVELKDKQSELVNKIKTLEKENIDLRSTVEPKSSKASKTSIESKTSMESKKKVSESSEKKTENSNGAHRKLLQDVNAASEEEAVSLEEWQKIFKPRYKTEEEFESMWKVPQFEIPDIPKKDNETDPAIQKRTRVEKLNEGCKQQ